MGNPTFRFHKDLEPEGKVFDSDALPDEKEGWVDSPEKFDPAWKETRAKAAKADRLKNGESPEEASKEPVARKKVSYPAHRFMKGEPDKHVEVADAEADARLERENPGVYKDTYDPAAWDVPKAAPKVKDASAAPKPAAAPKKAKAPKAAPKGKVGKKAAAATPAATPTPAGPSDAQRDEFLKANIAQLLEKIDAVGDASMLDTLDAIEKSNPAGPRNTVLKALKARRAALAASGE